jgi:hypothetical protein
MSSDYIARNHLHAGYSHPVSRELQSAGTEIQPHNLMWPIFLVRFSQNKTSIRMPKLANHLANFSVTISNITLIRIPKQGNHLANFSGTFWSEDNID